MERNILVDDLDGRWEDKNVEPHTLAVDDKIVDIDLHDESYAELLAAVEKFFNAGRQRSHPTGHLRAVPSAKPARNDPAQLKQIREWAWAHPSVLNGRTLSKHGRIPRDIREAYDRLAGREKGVSKESSPGGGSLFSDASKATATR